MVPVSNIKFLESNMNSGQCSFKPVFKLVIVFLVKRWINKEKSKIMIWFFRKTSSFHASLNFNKIHVFYFLLIPLHPPPLNLLLWFHPIFSFSYSGPPPLPSYSSSPPKKLMNVYLAPFNLISIIGWVSSQELRQLRHILTPGLLSSILGI